jgi:hypothetical protein
MRTEYRGKRERGEGRGERGEGRGGRVVVTIVKFLPFLE